MKSFFLCLLFSINAFADTNPFTSFLGNYKVTAKPQITSHGIYCDLSFLDINEVNITEKNNLVVLDFISRVDDTEYHLFERVEEYSKTQDGVTDTGKIEGDGKEAKYTSTSSYKNYVTVTEWMIRHTKDNYHFSISDKSSDPSKKVTDCLYDFELKTSR